MKPIPGACLLWVCMASVSCVPYPVHKKLQPESMAIIVDPDNTPIERAQVSLFASSYPDGDEKSQELKLTNSQGVVTFEAKEEWRMEMVMLRSTETFFWNWCIYKPGYETYRTAYRSADEWQDIVSISLTPGIASECHE